MDENRQPNQKQPEIAATPVLAAPATTKPADPAPAQPATQQGLRATEEKIERQIDERMTAFERSMIRLTRFGLAVTVLTGVIFAGQLYEMITGGTATDKLVDYAKKQATAASDIGDAAQQFSDIAEDTNSSVSDAVDQLAAAANNAKAGIRATQDATRLDQRAWLGAVVLTDLVIKPGEVGYYKVITVNSGKTPALHVSHQVWGQALPSRQKISFVYPATPHIAAPPSSPPRNTSSTTGPSARWGKLT